MADRARLLGARLIIKYERGKKIDGHSSMGGVTLASIAIQRGTGTARVLESGKEW